MKNQRIPELDGLRGIAIALVLAFHIPALPVRPGSLLGFVPVFQRMGWSGVDLFFVLSGFLIGGVLLDARESTNYFQVFYARRFFRIVPLYAVLLLVVGGSWLVWPSAKVLGIGRTGISLLPWVTYLLLLQNFAMTLYGTWGIIPLAVTWSLAVEEQFYLTLPLFIRSLSRRALFRVALGGIALAPLLRALCHHLSPQNYFSWFTLLPCRGDTLLLGVLAALLLRHSPYRAFLQARRRSLVLLLLVLLMGVASLALWAYDFHTSFTMLSAGMSVLAVFYATLLLYTVLFPSGWLGAGLRWRPLRTLGTVAYGVYLFHNLILQFFFNKFLSRRLPSLHSAYDLAILVSAFAALFLFCAVTWRFFEKPMLRQGQRWKYRGKALAQAPPAAHPQASLVLVEAHPPAEKA
jgi:peptidoglycan/LPS O-acetylase OafA/YrhL